MIRTKRTIKYFVKNKIVTSVWLYEKEADEKVLFWFLVQNCGTKEDDKIDLGKIIKERFPYKINKVEYNEFMQILDVYIKRKENCERDSFHTCLNCKCSHVTEICAGEQVLVCEEKDFRIVNEHNKCNKWT